MIAPINTSRVVPNAVGALFDTAIPTAKNNETSATVTHNAAFITIRISFDSISLSLSR